jgi:hypothetical protein
MNFRFNTVRRISGPDKRISASRESWSYYKLITKIIIIINFELIFSVNVLSGSKRKLTVCIRVTLQRLAVTCNYDTWSGLSRANHASLLTLTGPPAAVREAMSKLRPTTSPSFYSQHKGERGWSQNTPHTFNIQIKNNGVKNATEPVSELYQCAGRWGGVGVTDKVP